MMGYGIQPERSEKTILLVEDDPGHARLIKKNLRRCGVASDIVTMDDGQKAVDFLTAIDTVVIDQLLVLLDLNMPVMDGYQVLQRIKGDEKTRKIPVVVLTTTDSPGEIERCYMLGCNMYVTKPVCYDEFSSTIGKIGDLLSVVKIPGSH